jgi:hypothetical protein
MKTKTPPARTKVIVDHIKEIKYQRESKGGEPAHLKFAGGSRAILQGKGPDYQTRHEILRQHHHCGIPVYVEAERQKGVVKALHVPLEGRVVFSEEDGRGLWFQIDRSAKPFHLTRSDPRYARYQKLIHESQLKRTPLLLTESGGGTKILDISKPKKHGSQVPQPDWNKYNLKPRMPDNTVMMPEETAAVSAKCAVELFGLLKSQSTPLDEASQLLPFPTIPFEYPVNGCQARAHYMCRLLLEQGVQPHKVWNLAPDHKHHLIVKTRYDPKGEAKWGFHVSAAVYVRQASEQIERQVMDPSLFDKPVSVEAWRRRQECPESCLAYTTSAPYLFPWWATKAGIYDPDYHQTLRDLVRYNSALSLQIRKYGLPPYGK